MSASTGAERMRPAVMSCILFCAPIGLGPITMEASTTSDLDSYLKASGYEAVPFKSSEQNQPLVDGRLKDKRRVFLVDTGCGMTTLQPASAAGLKTLGQIGATLQDSFLGTLSKPSIVLMDKLQLERGQFFNQPALVEKLDMDFVRLRFDGILGVDFFFRNFCLIDCYRHRLYLRGAKPSDAQSEAFQQLLQRSGFTGVPLKAEHFLTVAARVKDEPVRLLIDTGDSISALDQSLATRLKLEPVKSDDPAKGSLIREDVSGSLIGFGKIGSHKVWVTRLDKFEIGPVLWTNISYGVANLSAWELARAGSPDEEILGLLGADLLAQHGALIDFPNRTLWFRPRKAE